MSTLYERYNPINYISRSFYVSQAKMWLRTMENGNPNFEECFKELYKILINHDLNLFDDIGSSLDDIAELWRKLRRIRSLVSAMYNGHRQNQYHLILDLYNRTAGKSEHFFEYFDDEFVEFMEGIVKQSVPFTSDRL